MRNFSAIGELSSRRGMKRSGHFRLPRPGLLSAFESFGFRGLRLLSERNADGITGCFGMALETAVFGGFSSDGW